MRAGRAGGENLGLTRVTSRRTFLWCPLALAASRAIRAADRKPNVVLIVAGTWRAQAVPWGGDPDVIAPNLARLASQGITFPRAYACYSRSDRSRLCLLKGVFPHALAGPEATVEALLAESPTLGSLLRGAGYRTATFRTLETDQIVSFVHNPGGAPFYAEWYVENVGSGLMERTNTAQLHMRDNVPAEVQARSRDDLAVFYARARTRDRDIGVVLEALDRPQLADDTIVVFTSIHGEQFGSHQGQGDDYVYEETIRIPLAIRYSRLLKAGSQNDMLVSQVDILPTLLHWCGAAIPESVQGRDLSALLEGQPGERPEAVYAEGRLGQKDEWRMLVHGYDKLVVDLEGNVTHLFNLAEDPYEMTNLANVSAEQLKRDSLLAIERQWTKKLGDGVDASGLKKR
jgi:arylsulfatase A-like enzyme